MVMTFHRCQRLRWLMGKWRLAVGYWLLAVGCLLLAFFYYTELRRGKMEFHGERTSVKLSC